MNEEKEFEELKKERIALPENVGSVVLPSGGYIMFTTFDGGTTLESKLSGLPEAVEQFQKI